MSRLAVKPDRHAPYEVLELEHRSEDNEIRIEFDFSLRHTGRREVSIRTCHEASMAGGAARHARRDTHAQAATILAGSRTQWSLARRSPLEGLENSC